MQKTEAQILADVMDNSRMLTRWYLSLLKETDPHRKFKSSEGTELNSVHWIACHLAWAENSLLLHATGGEPLKDAWLEDYRIQSGSEDFKERAPDMKEVMTSLKTIHAQALTHIRSLTNEQLNTDNALNMGFNGDNSVRMIIHHAIRHEACHTGQLGWLCKLNGIQTI